MELLIFFGDDEGETLIRSLDADPEVKEWQVKAKELLKCFVYVHIYVEWVDQREESNRPLVVGNALTLYLVLLLLSRPPFELN